MKTPHLAFVAPALLALGLLLAGCASGPQPKNFQLNFELAPSAVGSSIQIDVIGANEISDVPRWNTVLVTEYWQPNNPMRRDANKAVLQFSPGKANTQSLLSTDPIWNRWLASGADYLVVLVDLPGFVSERREGNADPRRLVLPIDGRKWGSDVKSLNFTVKESGIELVTRMKSR
jgi:hypothetical protein